MSRIASVGFCGGCGEPVNGAFCGECGRRVEPVGQEARATDVGPLVQQTAVIPGAVVAQEPEKWPPGAPTEQPVRVFPETPTQPGPLRGTSAPPRRGSALPAVAVVVGLLIVVGVGVGAVIASRQGWFPGGDEPTAVSTTTVTVSSPVSTVSPTDALPTAESTPTVKTPEELRVEALDALEAMVADDRGLSPVRGQWVAQLASKTEGIIDTTQQPGPFTLPDILAEIRVHQANAEYGSLVRVVHQGDWGQSEAGPEPMWVTFADVDMSSREDVVAWCEDHFTQRGQALLNVCYPRQMKLK